MPAINFPNSPNINDTFAVGSINYSYDGSKWVGDGFSPAFRIYEDNSTVKIVDNATDNADVNSGFFSVQTEGVEAFRVGPDQKLIFNNTSQDSIISGNSDSGVIKLYAGNTKYGGQITFNGGDSSSGSLVFKSGSTAGEQTTRMSITSDGIRVGDGIYNSSYNFDFGDATSNTIRVLNNGGTLIRSGSVTTGSDVDLLRVDQEKGETDDSNYGFTLSYKGSRTLTQKSLSIFSDNETGNQIEAVTVNQNGNVGLSCTNPTSPLHLKTDTGSIGTASQPAFRIGGTSNGDYGLGFYVDANSGYIRSQGTSGLHLVVDGGSTTGSHTAVNISQLADIRLMGTDGADKEARVTSPSKTTNEEDILLVKSSSTSASNILKIGGGDGSYNSATEITFYTSNGIDTLSGTQRLSIDNNGKVSIGSAIGIVPYTSNGGMLSFEGSSGQLFSITNNITTGSLFSVNDISGLPSIDVDASGDITLAEFTGNVGIGKSATSNKVDILGTLAASSLQVSGTKNFVIDHPTQQGKKLRYSCIEGPEAGVYYRGKSNSSVIELPEYWTGLVREETISVNLTPIKNNQSLWIESIENNKITVGSDSMEVEYFYIICGERKDVEKLEVEFS